MGSVLVVLLIIMISLYATAYTTYRIVRGFIHLTIGIGKKTKGIFTK